MLSYKDIIKLDSVDSTNLYAIKLIKEKKINRDALIWAKEQISGKGQGSNKWLSKANENLTFSIIVFPDISVDDNFLLLENVCLSLCDFFEEFQINAEIKWPNDIYVGDKKICGVLIENIFKSNLIMASVIGIGININQDRFPQKLKNPVSLKNLTSKNYDLETCLLTFITHFNRNFYSESGKFSIKNNVHHKYKEKIFRFGIESLYSVNKVENIGKIIDVDTSGLLSVQWKNNYKIEKFAFKEIEMM